MMNASITVVKSRCAHRRYESAKGIEIMRRLMPSFDEKASLAVDPISCETIMVPGLKLVPWW